MKKPIFLLLSLLCQATALQADDRATEILDRMAGLFTGWDSYRIEFRISAGQGLVDMPGTLTVSGERYFLDLPGDSGIGYDGTTVYTHTIGNGEVILENPDPNEEALFADPIGMFRLDDGDYVRTFRGEVSRGGRTLQVLELTPRRPEDFDAYTLEIDRASGLPVAIDYRMPVSKDALSIEILAITPNVAVGAIPFAFDPARHPGVEVIDFR
jgi:outer membrane lipoprotein-sorting protein